MAVSTYEGPRQTWANTPVVVGRSLPFLAGEKFLTRSENEVMTIEEALKLGGLDFDVEQRKVYTHTSKGHRVTVPGLKANVRTDTEEVLAVVGSKYTVEQYRDALKWAVEGILDTGEAQIESAWSLRGGRMGGFTFRIPGADIAVPGDAGGAIDMYGMLRTSHDGNGSLTFDIGPVRQACLNMIRMIAKSAVASIKIRHTSGLTARRALAARDTMGLTFRYSEFLNGEISKLLNTTLVESQVDAILKAAFPVREDATPAQRDQSVQHAIRVNYATSPTIDAIRGTGWGLVNAANEYFEHLQPVRTRTFDEDSVRGISILQGTAFQATNRVARAVLTR